MRPQVLFRRPSLGLALSGGGIRGVAHIGVLQVLEGAGIKPDIVTGTSAGSIIAGLYAYGISPDDMENFAVKTDPRQVFDLILSPHVALLMIIKIICDGFRVPLKRLRDVPAGIADNQRLARLVRDYTRGAPFDSLKLPCAVMATDINSGERVAFMSRRWVPRAILPKPTVYITDAPVYIAVKASTAIPGVFLPVKVGGRTLVDGGVTDYVPSEITRAMGADVVVAVDLGYADGEKEPVDNILEVVTQSIDIMGRELADLRLASSATVGVFPKVSDVGILDFDRIPECIERGREAARSALPDIEKALSRL